jgi:hypothetical protein
MASWAKNPAKTNVGSPPHRGDLTLVPPPEFKIQRLARRLPRVETPEGWIKKVDRAREGKVWVGYFHVWETTPDGRSVRRKKEKTLGPATRPKHEALKELGEYIAENEGEAPKQGEFISTFGELWRTFCAVQSGQWSKKTKENL